jgi:hypothetical protein
MKKGKNSMIAIASRSKSKPSIVKVVVKKKKK